MQSINLKVDQKALLPRFQKKFLNSYAKYKKFLFYQEDFIKG